MKRILLIGSGWRARTWANVIRALPGFEICVLCRNESKSGFFRDKGIEVVSSYEEAFSLRLDAALVCVSKTDNYRESLFLAEKNLLVLCETPAGVTLEECEKFSGSNVYIAEQYPFQPRFRAVKAVIDSGILGNVHTVNLSCCHGYHAVSLMRYLLGTGYAEPTVSAIKFPDEYFAIGGREGRSEPKPSQNARTLAYLDFGDKRATYDWSQGQYFSPVRSAKFCVQGDRGELTERGGCFIKNGAAIPFQIRVERDGEGGNLYPPDLYASYCLDDKIYQNKFYGLRFSEEEIAMADCLTSFLNGNGYSAKEGAFDAALAIKIEEASKKCTT